LIIVQKRGLGNQLFQYAAGLFFAEKYAASLEIAREPDRFAVSFGRPRPFMLSRYCISTPFRTLTLWDRLICSGAPAKRPVAALARLASGSEVYRQPVSEDRTFFDALPVRESAPKVYIEGNFQAHQFPGRVESRLRADLRLREPATGRNLAMLQQIEAAGAAVSLHVRRGDYALWSGGPRVLPIAYYRRAMDAIRQKVPRPTFFVFSDDMAYAREILPPDESVVFVDHNDEHNPHEDLRLMAACRHHIIANSTLSWWGAWLNGKPDKLVCAPVRWGLADPNERMPDLLPASWLQIPTDQGLSER
jgi:hypothetical protein